ncbi:MAG: phosphate signaling complex protein PhoU [Gemmatimonadota bacterium]|nr:phosphate signaling complex protein PhoU [Gemmatimonadota bacterium]
MTDLNRATPAFQERLELLGAHLLRMSVLADSLVSDSVEALQRRDVAAAHAVIAADPKLDALEMEIDDACLLLLALHQPVAADLRLVTSATKISKSLERVGDHAKHIAFVAREVAAERFPTMPEIDGMATLAKQMLTRALDHFVRADAEQARGVFRQDGEVDRLHALLVGNLVARMLNDPRQIGPCMSLLSGGRDLERIADLATNIAEDVVYFVEGRRVRREVELPMGWSRIGTSPVPRNHRNAECDRSFPPSVMEGGDAPVHCEPWGGT